MVDALKEIEGLTDLPEAIDVDLTPKDKDGKPIVEAKAPAGKEADAKPEDAGTASLRRQLEAQTRAREAAEARHRDEVESRRRAEEQTTEGQAKLIGNSLEQAQADRIRAKREYAEAMKAGEFDRAAEAQDALNAAAIRVDRLNQGKREIESKIEREKDEGNRRKAASVDPVEAVASKLPTKSAAWLRAHPECITDGSKNEDLGYFHRKALNSGLDLESPEYFAFIEKGLGIAHNDDAAAVEAPTTRRSAPEPAVKRDRAEVAAPVSRGTGDGRGSRENNTFTLSSAQRALCDEAGISYESYARNALALKKDGRIS